mgnify:CR=1 FL=1
MSALTDRIVRNTPEKDTEQVALTMFFALFFGLCAVFVSLLGQGTVWRGRPGERKGRAVFVAGHRRSSRFPAPARPPNATRRPACRADQAPPLPPKPVCANRL